MPRKMVAFTGGAFSDEAVAQRLEFSFAVGPLALRPPQTTDSTGNATA